MFYLIKNGVKMIKTTKILLLAFTVLLALSGCGTSAKILNIPKQEVHQTLSKQDMSKVIMRAGHSRGWEMNRISDSIIESTYKRRGFSVTCTISYTALSYQIEYKESEGLKYNEQSKTIHRNYNSWILNLKNQIELELSLQ
jgi:uncharacterized protein YceK